MTTVSGVYSGYPWPDANRALAKILSGSDGFRCEIKCGNPGMWEKTVT